MTEVGARRFLVGTVIAVISVLLYFGTLYSIKKLGKSINPYYPFNLYIKKSDSWSIVYMGFYIFLLVLVAFVSFKIYSNVAPMLVGNIR